jgi:hypothetical protein
MNDPLDVDNFLAHYGVKGMRWGVRREDAALGGFHFRSSSPLSDDDSSSDALSAKWRAVQPPKKELSSSQRAKSAEQNMKKFSAKFDASVSPSDPSAEVVAEKKGLSANQKRALKIGIGVLAVGALVGYAHYAGRQELLKEGVDPKNVGKVMSYNKKKTFSMLKTWPGENYITDLSHDRPEFELPAGHIFHRISRVPEGSFDHKTYSTHDIHDFNRYVVGFRGELGTDKLYHVTYRANEPVKVPRLGTVLETLKEVMSKDDPTITPETVHQHYRRMSGGDWDSPQAHGLFDALRSKGYSAIVDEMDAGVIGDTPLVVFAKNLSEKISTPMTSDDYRTAEDLLRPLTAWK